MPYLDRLDYLIAGVSTTADRVESKVVLGVRSAPDSGTGVESSAATEKLTAELPDLTSQLERGEFDDLAGWLRENLHRHGRKYTSKEMLERIAGGGMDPGPYIRYLKSKLGEIYGLPVEAATPA